MTGEARQGERQFGWQDMFVGPMLTPAGSEGFSYTMATSARCWRDI